MNRQRQFSYTMVTNTAKPFPTLNRHQQLLCNMIIMETARQTDFLLIHADDIRFVLSAYFLIFSLGDNEQHRLHFREIANVPPPTTARTRAAYILHISYHLRRCVRGSATSE